MEATTKKLRAAAPLPCRGGVGGGVSIFFAVRMLQTPPLPLPLMGGEWLRSVFCRLNHGYDFFKWTHIYLFVPTLPTLCLHCLSSCKPEIYIIV